jgi:hypothetical protein
MNNQTKKIFRGFFICILVRSIFVLLAYKLTKDAVYYMAFPAAIISIGFIISFINFNGSGNGVFGGEIWWNNLRLVHGIIYGIFAYMAVNYNKFAYRPLMVDIIIGAVSFIAHYRKLLI